MNRWKDRAVQRRKCRSHGVYVEEPHLLPETLSASMSESQKFGTLCTHVWLLKNLANGSTSKTENSRLLHTLQARTVSSIVQSIERTTDGSWALSSTNTLHTYQRLPILRSCHLSTGVIRIRAVTSLHVCMLSFHGQAVKTAALIS